ncbi:hypothetical protein [Neorhodopirellula pilleata]|uniref:Uncharacterized protein n=1 Tax=Neorhodopirellula pilleata TaxID=2714738 RepID=A0A5C5ZQS3_9BACT|nr:hypothetical protein [Neorhodopirellula pilleata]TWT89566.1 hypothetical protein Pla100_54950 [Neorhodopirellula pilleata]
MNHETESDPTSLPVSAESLAKPSCCGLSGFFNVSRLWAVGCAVVTLTAIGAATYFAGAADEARRQAEKSSANPWSDLPIANATAAVTSEKYSLATGLISEGTEALFVLDHNSGLLQCSVVYPRMGRFLATFTCNVADALGTDGKGGTYIMATGTADFPRSSNRPVGFSVVYVLDTATGNYACYGVPFDRVAMNANRPQQGLMVLISQGSANPVIDRDDLR